MELNEYQERAMSTCMDSSRNVEYMLLNLIGEVGELAEKILPCCKDYETRRLLGDMVVTGQQAGKCAKGIRKGEVKVYCPISVTDMSNEQKVGIIKEAGDVAWQLSGLANVLEYTLQDVCDINLAKLSARKQAGTIDVNGDGVSGKERTV